MAGLLPRTGSAEYFSASLMLQIDENHVMHLIPMLLLLLMLSPIPPVGAQTTQKTISEIDWESVCSGRRDRFQDKTEAERRRARQACEQAVRQKIDVEDCIRQGGTIRPVCLMQEPMCVIPYPDAGRPCRDGDDCAGACLATTAGNQGEPAAGVCQHNNDPCGCRTYVEDGRIARGICVD